LSENPDFVDACDAAGIVFIGPSADAIRAMGLKDAAKALMEKAGVPVVPGYHGANQDTEHLAGAADAIGYPVLIKAVAGGGGKGMRLVETPDQFATALQSARNEARAAFGNDAVLIEKLVSKPRHIEVQVFGDGQDAVHLFERDCSLQRRHQKVIEEAPAPGMTDEMRHAMGQAAVNAARAIGYRGAGTVEFIVDSSDGLRSDRFWFMEMNTRLQVEHPVTEAITGVDLVAWQLRVAAGEPLPARQDDLAIDGHAFEARLYAEDVPAGFLPATGRLSHLVFPQGVRADTGVRQGDEISPWYDPMIAKIIVHGPTRDIALSRLTRALESTQVAGSVTNLSFLGALSRHRGFVKGDVDTGLISRDLAALVEPAPVPLWADALAVLGASGTPGDAPLLGFAIWARPSPEIRVTQGDRQIEARLTYPGGPKATVSIDGNDLTARWYEGGWQVDGQGAVEVVVEPGRVHVFAGSGSWTYDRVDLLDRQHDGGVGSDVVTAPMPGLVRSIMVVPGQNVQQGDRLATLEAMKMEHSLAAPRDGVIKDVLVVAESQVEAHAALITLEPEE
jgi:3-methylcrotonyl-CoA carboxylase alpha subunit